MSKNAKHRSNRKNKNAKKRRGPRLKYGSGPLGLLLTVCEGDASKALDYLTSAA